MAVSFKGAHFPQAIIRTGVRWYVAYPLSTRQVEELRLERGVHVGHATINRWVIKDSPQREAAFHRRERPVWVSWRMDETSIRVKGANLAKIAVTDPAGAADLLQRHDPLAVARVGPCWMPTSLECVTSAPLRQGPWQGLLWNRPRRVRHCRGASWSRCHGAMR